MDWKIEVKRIRDLWKFSVLSILYFLLFIPYSIASPPVKFTYQGNLRQQGFLVTGQRQMQFRLYTSSDAVGAIWTSPVYNVSISTGVFRVTLEPSLLSPTDWESNYWLELEIEGTKLSPREEITSVPYAINTLLHSGKRFTTSNTAPDSPNVGDLWMDTATATLKFWNGSTWVSTAGSGAAHAATHAGSGSDPITSLGTHTVTGDITMAQGTSIKGDLNSLGVSISTHLIVTGAINPQSNLNIGGAGYSVNFASSVWAGWFYGDGSGLTNLNASNISSGFVSGDRIGNVIVSTHIVDASILGQDIASYAIGNSHIQDSSITRNKLAQDGCNSNQILKWDGSNWVCADLGAIVESDPLSVHIQDTLQAGATFYVSSGTVNHFNVNEALDVYGTARIRGSTTTEGIFVNNQGQVGIGTANVTPNAKVEITGGTNSGDYLMIVKSGNDITAWIRKK